VKIRMEPDGTIEIDANGGDAQAAVRLLRQLQQADVAPTPAPAPAPTVPVMYASPFAGSHRQATRDPAGLNTSQRRIYDIIAAHGEGCYYKTVHAELADGRTDKAVNSLCNRLCNEGYVTRLSAGVYQVYRGGAV